MLYKGHYLPSLICLLTVCIIWAIVKSQSVATTPDQIRHGWNGNETVLYIPQILKPGVQFDPAYEATLRQNWLENNGKEDILHIPPEFQY